LFAGELYVKLRKHGTIYLLKHCLLELQRLWIQCSKPTAGYVMNTYNLAITTQGHWRLPVAYWNYYSVSYLHSRELLKLTMTV